MQFNTNISHPTSQWLGGESDANRKYKRRIQIITNMGSPYTDRPRNPHPYNGITQDSPSHFSYRTPRNCFPNYNQNSLLFQSKMPFSPNYSPMRSNLVANSFNYSPVGYRVSPSQIRQPYHLRNYEQNSQKKEEKSQNEGMNALLAAMNDQSTVLREIAGQLSLDKAKHSQNYTHRLEEKIIKLQFKKMALHDQSVFQLREKTNTTERSDDYASLSYQSEQRRMPLLPNKLLSKPSQENYMRSPAAKQPSLKKLELPRLVSPKSNNFPIFRFDNQARRRNQKINLDSQTNLNSINESLVPEKRTNHNLPLRLEVIGKSSLILSNSSLGPSKREREKRKMKPKVEKTSLSEILGEANSDLELPSVSSAQKTKEII